jgi:transposase-like protein
MTERKCLDCGRTWVLETRLARAKPPRRLRGFTLGAGFAVLRTGTLVGGSMDLQGAVAQHQQAQIDDMYQRVEEAQRCPSCASGHFSERRYTRSSRQALAASDQRNLPTFDH